jgi:hypothetical protein
MGRASINHRWTPMDTDDCGMIAEQVEKEEASTCHADKSRFCIPLKLSF